MASKCMFDFKASKYLTHFTLFRSKVSGSNFQFGNLSFNRFGLQVAVNSITVSPIITPAGPTKKTTFTIFWMMKPQS